jgi:hypothetical protein
MKVFTFLPRSDLQRRVEKGLSSAQFAQLANPPTAETMERKRQYCHRCGEESLPEHLANCVSCGHSVCAECGVWITNPATQELHLICDQCDTNRLGWWNNRKGQMKRGVMLVLPTVI